MNESTVAMLLEQGRRSPRRRPIAPAQLVRGLCIMLAHDRGLVTASECAELLNLERLIIRVHDRARTA